MNCASVDEQREYERMLRDDPHELWLMRAEWCDAENAATLALLGSRPAKAPEVARAAVARAVKAAEAIVTHPASTEVARLSFALAIGSLKTRAANKGL